MSWIKRLFCRHDYVIRNEYFFQIIDNAKNHYIVLGTMTVKRKKCTKCEKNKVETVKVIL